MEITMLENQHIKIGKTSITVKNAETGKTCGVVRNVCKFKDLQPNKATDYFNQLRTAGAWGSGIDGLIDCVIIADDQLYYLHNLKPIDAYNQYWANVEGCESAKILHEKRLQIAENMKQFATVIPCYVD